MNLKKLAFIIVLAVVSPVVLFCGFIWLQDLSYGRYEFTGVKPENRQALLLTWEAPQQPDFWENYEKSVHRALKSSHQKGELLLSLPFSHPSLQHPEHSGAWTHCVLLVLREMSPAKQIGEELEQLVSKSDLSRNLRSVDLLRLQNGLDIFYPVRNGLAREKDMKQTIEYVFSKPEARKDYYGAQYQWSGPAMADLHHRDKAGRFIGFEVQERLFETKGMPRWDLIHIFGFTPWQSWKAQWFFFSTWNKHARRVFGEGATFQSVIAKWNDIRLNLKQPAVQNIDLTLQMRD